MKLERIVQMIRLAMVKTGAGLIELGKGADVASVLASLGVKDKMNWHVKWTVFKYADETAAVAGTPFEVVEFEKNLLLNEGINEMLNLLIGGSATTYSNANARIGIGDSAVAAAATQVDLQAATNKLYKGMDTGYPQVTNQTVSFKSTFGANEANWAWNEFSVDNGATAGKNLNRKAQSLGVKANPAVWTLLAEITIS